MYSRQSRIAVARAHSFYGNANVARGFGEKSLQRARVKMAKNCSPVPAVERREFSRSPVYRVMAGSW